MQIFFMLPNHSDNLSNSSYELAKLSMVARSVNMLFYCIGQNEIQGYEKFYILCNELDNLSNLSYELSILSRFSKQDVIFYQTNHFLSDKIKIQRYAKFYSLSNQSVIFVPFIL